MLVLKPNNLFLKGPFKKSSLYNNKYMYKEGANDEGQTDLAFLGESWQPEALSGQQVSADHLCGRVCRRDKEGETKVRLTRLRPMGLKHTDGRTLKLGGSWKSQVVWGRSDETQPPQRENLSENEGHRWAGREGRAKTVTEKRRGSCQSLTLLPAPPCLLGWVGSATLRHGERLPNPSLRFGVGTRSLPPPSNK